MGVNNGTDAIYLALKSLDIKNNDEIEVRSILGKLIYLASNVNRIQTSEWDAGIYFLHLHNKNITYKIIKL